jgi:hypothetical protein
MIKGMGLGAGLMYFFDPDSGRWRRALVRDQLVSAGHDLEDLVGASARDLKNRARGVAAESSRWAEDHLGRPVDLRPETWPPSARLLAGAAGVLVGLQLFRRRPATSLALGAIALGIAVQNLSRGEPRRDHDREPEDPELGRHAAHWDEVMTEPHQDTTRHLRAPVFDQDGSSPEGQARAGDMSRSMPLSSGGPVGTEAPGPEH